MISRRAEVGIARTRLLPAWIARGSALAKRSKSLLSISLSSTCRRSDPITAGRRKSTLAAILRTPPRANAAQIASRQSAPSVTPGRIGSSLASTETCAAINSAACASRDSGVAAPGSNAAAVLPPFGRGDDRHENRAPDSRPGASPHGLQPIHCIRGIPLKPACDFRGVDRTGQGDPRARYRFCRPIDARRPGNYLRGVERLV